MLSPLEADVPGAWSKKLPKGKAWRHHSDREDLAGLRAKFLTGLGHPLYCVSVSLKQELNKLKPPPQPVNLTGRLLLQLGKSLLCDIAHLWQAARNNAPFFWNYGLQSHSWLGVHMQCSLQKDRSASVSLSKTHCTLSNISLISGSTF